MISKISRRTMQPPQSRWVNGPARRARRPGFPRSRGEAG
jgi:hypothetical protein